MNKVDLIGRVTKDIELKKTQSNISVVKFTLAVDKGYGEKKRTNFIECQAWKSTADTMANYVLKGDMVGISGELINNNYESNGIKYYSYLVNVNELTLLPNKRNKAPAEKNMSFKRNEIDVNSEFIQDTLSGDGKDLMGFGSDDNLPFY